MIEIIELMFFSAGVSSGEERAGRGGEVVDQLSFHGEIVCCGIPHIVSYLINSLFKIDWYVHH